MWHSTTAAPPLISCASCGTSFLTLSSVSSSQTITTWLRPQRWYCFNKLELLLLLFSEMLNSSLLEESSPVIISSSPKIESTDSSSNPDKNSTCLSVSVILLGVLQSPLAHSLVHASSCTLHSFACWLADAINGFSALNSNWNIVKIYHYEKQ